MHAASDRLFQVGALIGLVANLATYAYVWSVLPHMPQLMPLHYNGEGMVDLLGRPAELFKLPGIGTILLALDVGLAARLHRAERPLAQVLLWTGLAAQVLLAVGVGILAAKANGE